MKKLRKGTAFVLSGVLVCCMLSACGKSDQDGAAGSENEEKSGSNGKVVVYNCNTDDWTAPIIKEFQEKTGIEVELVGGGSGELIARVKAESENPLGDVIFGGAPDSYKAIRDSLEPYESAEKKYINEDFIVEDNSFYNVTIDPYAMAYNTDLVSEDEAPKGWEDLLDQKWKGKIALADPSKSSSTYSVLITMMQKLGGDFSTIEALVDNLDSKIASGSSAQIKGLSDGEYAVTATFEEAILKYISNGAHMKIVYPQEGTAVSSGCIGIIKDCKNEENAKLFLDFVLSKEVQETFGTYNIRSVRTDVEVPDTMEALSDFKYDIYDLDYGVEHREEFLKQWQDYVTR